MTYLSDCQFTDYLIYDYLDDKSLCSLCQTAKQFSMGDEYYCWRILNLYGSEIVKCKPADITCKQQYIDIIRFLYVNFAHNPSLYKDRLTLVSSYLIIQIIRDLKFPKAIGLIKWMSQI